MASLRKLTEHEFNDFLTEALRHKYVYGLRIPNIRKRLLAEKNIDLQKTIDILHGLEEADSQRFIITNSQNFKNKTEILKLKGTFDQKIKQ